MTFSNKITELQRKYPQDVILIKNGIFFVAVGKDALFLNKELNLKCTCFGNQVCKVGFLVKSAENYINKMKKLGISFIDVENYERVRMKNQLENIIKNIKNENPDLKSLEIKLEHRENEICFVSLAGKDSTKLKITPRNIDYWISLEANVENKIKRRIAKDKQFVRQYEEKVLK